MPINFLKHAFINFFICFFGIGILQVRHKEPEMLLTISRYEVTKILDDDNCQFVIIINLCYESQRSRLV